jgi:hypothetical protein
VTPVLGTCIAHISFDRHLNLTPLPYLADQLALIASHSRSGPPYLLLVSVYARRLLRPFARST